MSYDSKRCIGYCHFIKSQSLWNRAVSYDQDATYELNAPVCLNPFGTGQCLTTLENMTYSNVLTSLNPFGTGQCLTTNFHKIDENYLAFVSIPLEQGSVLRLFNKNRSNKWLSLNPFGTGQCLTTE